MTFQCAGGSEDGENARGKLWKLAGFKDALGLLHKGFSGHQCYDVDGSGVLAGPPITTRQ